MRSFALKIENPHSHRQGTACCCCTLLYSTILHGATNVLIIRFGCVVDKKSICFSKSEYCVSESFFSLPLRQHQAFAHEFYTYKKCPESLLSLSWTQHKPLCCAELYCVVLCCVVMRCDLTQFCVITFAIIAYSTVDTPFSSVRFSKCLITSRDSITNLNEWFVIFFYKSGTNSIIHFHSYAG